MPKVNGVEGKAIDELWQSCVMAWLEDPNYKLTHMSKKDREKNCIATGGRFVTLVTPKDYWPIIFTGRQKKLPGTE